MKVCLISEEYPEETNFGGIATYQKILGQELTKIGHEVIVITRGLKEDKVYYDGKVKVIRIYNPISSKKVSDYEEYREKIKNIVIELVNNNQIDIIETPEWGAEIVKYIHERKIPIIVKLHTPLCIWKYYNKRGIGDKKLNEKMIQWEKEVIYNADKIVSCSNILLQKLKNYYLDLDYSKIEVVPNPCNVNIIKSDGNHDTPIILYVGSLEQRKGVDILAKAITLFMDKTDNKDIKFLFIGKDTKRNDKEISMIEYIKNIVPKKYHSNLKFLGHLENSELNDYYGKCLMGIIPSIFDNYPYVAQEMLLNELPIITSDNTGVKEMIENQVSGLLFKNQDYKDLASKMLMLYKNKELRKKISSNSKSNIIKKCSPEIIVERMVDVYEKTIDEFKFRKRY